jgi:hypothetical protein
MLNPGLTLPILLSFPLLDPAFSLQLEDVKALLQSEAPHMYNSLLQRKKDIAALGSSGWQAVTTSRRPGGAAGNDALQHWVRGNPVSDWHFKQQLLQAQHEEAEKQRMQEEGLVDEQGKPWFASDFAWSTGEPGLYRLHQITVAMLLLSHT